ncbi:DUF5696 domain-containing protein [Planctomyces sp. SH-PL62]|uniref:DUF5696 domain-containing protein n=1 Tax=Planctomyces sp. SH-PL62 TaxID=1636152 RepID=UPI00078B9973|nr:DUF5696 domain-containing protein [Planctomyces sp. SH-PL62]AMV40723.1 hypothetical protein VT85_25045 [Planctomyces sp. SH-PL62]
MRGWILIMGLAVLGAGGPPADPLLVRPDKTAWNLDEVGLYRVGFAYRGQPEVDFPVGWSGRFDERSGVTLAADGLRNGRAAVLQHSPWQGGTGTTFQEFHVQLPAAKRIILEGATALREDGVGKSDGVGFRVLADGKPLLDELRTDAAWKPFAFDLTAKAGQVVVLRFETNCGPQGNASFDFSLWSGRRLVLDGFQPPQVSHPAPPPVVFRGLASKPDRGLAPPATSPTKVDWRREGDAFVLRSTDDYGSFAFRWTLPAIAPEAGAPASNLSETGVLGGFVLEADRKGAPTARVPLATTARITWTGPARPREARWEETADGPILVRTFEVDGQLATLRVKGTIAGRSLALDAALDRPVVEQIDAGSWGPVASRRDVPTPYYDGTVSYLPAEDLFVSSQVDWTDSAASRIETTRADYLALTDKTRITPTERFLYSAAWNIDEVLPNIPHRPSAYIKELSDRVVLDIWGGRYADIAGKLEALHDAGLERLAVIIHDWQRSGYDNALPAHFPAAEDKGGEAGMRTLKATGERLGYLIALHENYVDYYPNFEGFDEKHIAVDSEGKRQNAWFHPGNKIQSFAIKPTAMLDLAKTQSPEIHRRYDTKASFLDVNSSVPPWFHVDQQAGLDGAGTFQRVRRAHREVWDFLRETHGGPVFGEGNHHWYWSGLLDGAEAQFGSGWPGDAGLDAPLFVDFDLLKIHPLQFNHGMGYYERWWDKARVPQGSLPPVAVLDQYRVQEVAFGHAGFLGGNAWASVPLAWLEYNLLAPVMPRYAASAVTQIHYERDGRWVDASAVVRDGGATPDAWNRVRVRYDGGLTLVANQSADPLKVEGAELPQFGWLARAEGLTAGTTLRNGVVTDSVETPDSFFANARSAGDWNFSGVRRVQPTATFRQTGPRTFSAAYAWKVREPLKEDFHTFVHFGKVGEDDTKILFQQDHGLARPTTEWKAGTTVDDGPYTIRIPDVLPDGDYAWMIGLHTPSAGRVALEGPTDKTGRNLLGVVRVSDGGKTLRFKPEKDVATDRAAISLVNLNKEGKIVDFGPIKTDGGVSIRKVGNDWVAHVYPRDRAFSLQLDMTRFGKPTDVRAEDGSTPRVSPTFDGRWMRIKPNGARSYRWPAG